MYVIHRSIDVDFAHHVRGHAGGCINIHGHTWKFEVALSSSELDAQGFVIDFGELSRHVLRPVHDLLDHSLALGEDTFAEVSAGLSDVGRGLLASRAQAQPVAAAQQLGGACTRYPGGMKVAVFPFAPTSERLAAWLYHVAEGALSSDRVSVRCARIYETLHPVESVAEYWP